jgi:hypothetical protein
MAGLRLLEILWGLLFVLAYIIDFPIVEEDLESDSGEPYRHISNNVPKKERYCTYSMGRRAYT